MVTTEPIRATTLPTETIVRPARGRWMFWVGLLMVIATAIFWIQQSKILHTNRIAFITAGIDPYWGRVIDGARAAAKISGVRLTVMQPHSMKEQTADLDKAVSDGFDAVAISPDDADQELNDLDKAAAATTLVTVDTDCPLSSRLCFIGSDNYEAGRECADLVMEAIPDGGAVIICAGSLSKNSAQRRRQGLIDALLNRSSDRTRSADPVKGELKGDKYTILTTLLGESDFDKATQLTAQAVKDYPNVKCFVGLVAYSTPAILEGLKRAGAPASIKVVGFDCDPRTMAGISDGTVFGTIRQHQYEAGYEAVRILSGAISGHRATAVPTYPAVRLSVDPLTKQSLEAEAEAAKGSPTTKPATS